MEEASAFVEGHQPAGHEFGECVAAPLHHQTWRQCLNIGHRRQHPATGRGPSGDGGLK